MSMCTYICVCVCVLHIHTCLHVAGETCSASLLIGLVQPHLYKATGFGSPNTVLPVARSAATQLPCQSCSEPGSHRPRADRMCVPSPSLTYILPLWIFLDPTKCRVLVCPLWVRETCPSMNSALMLSFCCPNTRLFSMSALVYDPTSTKSASSKSTLDSSRNRVQERTAFSCR